MHEALDRYKSPLRYPGGKQKLAPFILELMMENGLAGGHYVEPYAGGAGVGIELLLSGNACEIHLNDSCKRVYAFWRAVLERPEELCHRIDSVPLTIDEWRRQQLVMKQPTEFGSFDLGFSTFYLNRCNRSGILSGGAIGGLKQEGRWRIGARFPRRELIRRIEAIAARRRHISLYNLDAEAFIAGHVSKLPQCTFVYLDPPYFRKADRLYLDHYQPEDHRRIAGLVKKRLKRPWMVSYDDAAEVIRNYRPARHIKYALYYNAGEAYTGKEVAFFSNGLRLPRQSAVKGIDEAIRRQRRLNGR